METRSEKESVQWRIKLGEDDWGVRAVRYRSNGFISAPLDDRYSREPTDFDIQLWFDNPKIICPSKI